MEPEETKEDALQQYAIPGIPPAMYYIPNFITEEEEAYIMSKVSFPPQFLHPK